MRGNSGFTSFSFSWRRYLLVALALAGIVPATVWGEEWIYTVRPGDNLWDFSKEYLTSMRYWQRLQTLNQVKEPLRMPPGMKLRVPMAWLRVQPAAVTVVQVSGDVQVKTDEAMTSAPATAGMSLVAGAEVFTGPAGSATLEFADGSRLLVQGGTQLKLDTISAYGRSGMVDTRMRLQQGRVDNRVRPSAGPGSRYEIETPAAVTAVRGTVFRVSAEAGRPVTRTEVLEGTVGVSGQEASQLVPAGFGMIAEAGKPPAAPRPLPPAPDLASLPVTVDRLPVRFQWPGQDGAAGYRVQLAPDAGFEVLLRDMESSKPEVVLGNLEDGNYVLRVRVRDDAGLEGLNSDRAFVVDARPEPPALIAPPAGQVLRDPRPLLRWAVPEGAVAYHLQLARDEGLTDFVLDQEADFGGRYRLESELAPGHYYWRIATRDQGGEQGPFSDIQDFEVRAIPASPALAPPTLGADRAVFRWQAAGEGVRYQFQLATDPDFREIEVDQVTETAEISLPALNPDVYYLRVRTIDADGYAGPFGTVQEVEVPPSPWPLLLLAVPLLFAL